VPLARGFVYLTAVLDWYSRYVLSWELSARMDSGFCLSALEEALGQGTPEIFNTDQGAQFTSRAFTGRLEQAGIAINMDGRGRALDNVFVERLWRSVKYEGGVPARARHGRTAGGGTDGLLRALLSRAAAPRLGNRTPADVYGLTAGQPQDRRVEGAEPSGG
jgi:putative transposase